MCVNLTVFIMVKYHITQCNTVAFQVLIVFRLKFEFSQMVGWFYILKELFLVINKKQSHCSVAVLLSMWVSFTSLHLQQQQLALDLQVKCDLIRPPVVAGHTAVVARVLCFHCADDEAAVAMDTAATIHQNRGGSSVSAGEEKKKKAKKRQEIETFLQMIIIQCVC